MAARKMPQTSTASTLAWRRFSKLARLTRESHDDAELRAVLVVRLRLAFEQWVAEEEELAAK